MRAKGGGRLAWSIVAVLLIVMGLHDILIPEIYGRVRMPESQPLLAGTPVVVLGLVQFALGIGLLYRQWRPQE